MTEDPDLFEHRADGCFIDGYQQLWQSESVLEKIPFLQPNNGAPVIDRILLVNGIMTEIELHFSDMQALANTGAEVIGIHNSTRGLWRDLKQCVYDLMNKGDNAAANTTKEVIRSTLETRKDLHLVGHSQGAIIISRALRNIVTELKESGIPRQKIPDMLSHLKIETYGGGAAYFTDGPQYVHVDNWLDPIPFHMGVGASSQLFNQRASPGKGAVQYTFFQLNNPWKRDLTLPPQKRSQQIARFVDYMIHGPQDIYFPQRKSFAAMRSGEYSGKQIGFLRLHTEKKSNH